MAIQSTAGSAGTTDSATAVAHQDDPARVVHGHAPPVETARRRGPLDVLLGFFCCSTPRLVKEGETRARPSSAGPRVCSASDAVLERARFGESGLLRAHWMRFGEPERDHIVRELARSECVEALDAIAALEASASSRSKSLERVLEASLPKREWDIVAPIAQALPASTLLRLVAADLPSMWQVDAAGGSASDALSSLRIAIGSALLDEGQGDASDTRFGAAAADMLAAALASALLAAQEVGATPAQCREVVHRLLARADDTDARSEVAAKALRLAEVFQIDTRSGPGRPLADALHAARRADDGVDLGGGT